MLHGSFALGCKVTVSNAEILTSCRSTSRAGRRQSIHSGSTLAAWPHLQSRVRLKRGPFCKRILATESGQTTTLRGLRFPSVHLCSLSAQIFLFPCFLLGLALESLKVCPGVTVFEFQVRQVDCVPMRQLRGPRCDSLSGAKKSLGIVIDLPSWPGTFQAQHTGCS